MAAIVIRTPIFFPVFTLIILLLTSVTASNQPTYLYSVCSNTTKFANNSQYEANLNTLFRFLSSNSTDSSGYHQAAVYGTGEAVFGHFLCRGDQNASSCQGCVTTATSTDLPKTYCPNRRVAIIWYDECMVRYSDQPFFGEMNSFPSVSLVNTQNVNGNETRFTDLMGDMMSNVIAVQAALGGPLKKFATDFVNFTSSVTIYGLGQCTPDLNTSDCNTCLETGIGNLYVRMGARVMQPSCVVRYEIYPFFDLSSVAPPPGVAPAPPSGNGTRITIVNNCNYAVWPGISTTGGSVDVPTGFSLPKGESQVMNIQSSWAGKLWGRTLCSINKTTGRFSCETGDCSTGKIECEDRPFRYPVTVANFRIGQIENQDRYAISINYGYNLPMMVLPRGQSEARCSVTGCVFNLDDGTCPAESSVKENGTHNTIGCKNPCDVPQKCCKFNDLCDSSDYLSSSRLFEMSCPRANINPFDLINTTFSCQSYETSYYVTFCPSPNMIRLFSTPFQSIQESMPPGSSPSSSSSGSPGKSKTSVIKVVGPIVVPIAVLALLISLCTCHFRRKAKKRLSIDIRNVLEDFTTAESLMFELDTLKKATNNFSDDRKLGGGGFGNVYKGTLPNGQDIAVKRLSRISDQGIESFKNEAVLIAKLQHKNLVKLLGFCLTREEKLLVYEFVPNKSLNYILFDSRKQGELDWPTRYNIILGIARGLLYLHEDSRPRIIHRDLKAANILLEADMNPKIADFGLARIFKVEQTEDDTSIVAGTYGYMAPEYAMHGQFSIKSDVYSFGVLLLEIVSGKKINSRFHPSGVGDLLIYAWRSWKDDTPFVLMDPTLRKSYSTNEVLRCIHLGLLCVQENALDRPTMSTVVFMLNTNSTTSTLPTPQRPRFYHIGSTESSHATRENLHSTTTSSSGDSMPHTRNQVTISDTSPR